MIKKCIWLAFPAALMFGGCSHGNPSEEVSVYPIPQEMNLSGAWITMPEEGYRIESKETPDNDAVELLKQSVTVAGQAPQAITIEKMAEPAEEMKRSGAYTLSVSRDGIVIGINDGRSLFYAVQTLCQLVGAHNRIPACEIRDYPDIPFRGVVEGFYGNPWSYENRVEQLRFYGRMKMNTYIFGPKDDPYHRSPSWRIPYPEEQAGNIRRLVEEAHRNKVDFVWALHPGMDIRWNEQDRQAAVKKLESMYELGVRAFAVFFDDIEGEGTDARRQADFMNYLKAELVDKKGDIQQLLICPTEYNKDWAKTDYLDVLGKNLDPFIQIMWTGDKVVSDITADGLAWVNNRIGRPCYIWWNFPVSDYCLSHLLMGQVYGLDKNTAQYIHAFVSNPMEYAEASKVALWSVAQYTWNMEAYDPQEAWEHSCASLVPEAPEAFRLFCEHNADIGPNAWLYFRQESFNSHEMLKQFGQKLTAGNYSEKEATEIIDLFGKLKEAPGIVRIQAANRELIKEIDPWLTQTANVGNAGLEAMMMLELAEKKDEAGCREAYDRTQEALKEINALNRRYRRGEQDGVKSGSQVLMPFIHAIVEYVENTLLTDKKPAERPTVLAGSKEAEKLSCFCEDDMVGLTPDFPGVTVAPNEYFGFRIEADKQPVTLVYELRKSKCADREFQASTDGETWVTLPQKGNNRMDTLTIADPATRYVRYVNTSKSENTVGIGRFLVICKQ